MPNSLVAPAALADFPGAPFTDALVDSAVSAVRGEAGWHIAPAVIETLVVESVGGHLFLPTLQLTAVTAVRDVTNEDAVAVTVTGWRSQATARFRAGVLHLASRTRGGVFEVDVTHGYTECPPELLPVLARRCDEAKASGAGQVRLGSLSIGTTTGTTVTAADAAVVGRFKIPGRP